MGNTITLPNSTPMAPLSRKRPRLRLLYTPAEGIVKNRVFSLSVGKTWLGRELPPDHEGITVAGDAGLSAIHALFEVSPNDYQVRLADWCSKNGTFLGRTRLAQPQKWYPLQEGDVVRAGNSLFLLRSEPAQTADAEIPSLVGASLALRELRARIALIAPESAPVLILGETGTGKEVVARALHQLSRRPGALVSINCAAIPNSLAESELFGHIEGSFTGAHARQGAFRRADRGTLFLDEIGDMPLEIQAKFLRVVEEGTITPIGSDRSLPLDVRVIAATHRDLQAVVRSESFRNDLYARLGHLKIALPPLSSRREDILLLLAHFWTEADGVLTPDVAQDLLLYDWPLNVRELHGIAERLRIEGITDALRQDLRRSSEPAKVEVAAELTPSASSKTPPAQRPPASRPYRLPTPSKERLDGLLRKHLGTVQYVADELGCSRKKVSVWLAEYGMDADDYRKLPE
jgi:DNA-binding NtrC family response regulator